MAGAIKMQATPVKIRVAARDRFHDVDLRLRFDGSVARTRFCNGERQIPVLMSLI